MSEPKRIRVCIRLGKDDWIGVAYSSDAGDPSTIYEYVPAQQWQPIETAPRDGTPLQMFSPSEYFDIGNTKGGMIWISGGWRDTNNGWRGDYGHDNPTHWMPLPEPPK